MKQEIKIIQHADDFTLPVKKELSLQETLNTIDAFCKHSGMKVYKYKTECLLLGYLKGTASEFFQIKVTQLNLWVYTSDITKRMP